MVDLLTVVINTQNFQYNATRMLQQQLQRTTTALEKLKAENATTKVRHIEWEEEQSKKLRDYREQRKQWQMEMAKAREQVAEFEAILKVQDGQLEQARKRYLFVIINTTAPDLFTNIRLSEYLTSKAN